MSLRDVTIKVEDGSLGNQNSTGENVHVKIGVSSVKSDSPLLITAYMKPEQIKEKVGLSPLYDAALDSIENGAPQLYCIPVTPKKKGKAGEVSHLGESTGTVTVSGDANNAYEVSIQITTSGTLNEAACRYSVNGGYTYSDELTIPLGGALEIPYTGLTVTFAGDFEESDVYAFGSTAPEIDNAAVLAAVESLYNSDLSFEFIHIVGPSAKALWAALGSAANQFLKLYKRPVWFLCEARYIGADESLDDYAAALKAEAKGIDNYFIQVCAAYSQYTRWDGRSGIINNAGIVAGLYGLASVQDSIGQTDTYSISEAKMTSLMPEGIEDFISDLDDAKYLTFRKYYGVTGCYVNNARMLCKDGSDYRYAEHVRVLCKMIRQIYLTAVPMLQMNISASDDMETDINNILERLMIPLEDMESREEITSATLSVTDMNEINIVQDENLPVKLTFVPRGYIREFDFDLSMTNPYRS